ncbi:MAG: hypothetical protein ACOWYE_08710 [Desulfatiglandales bacterium]
MRKSTAYLLFTAFGGILLAFFLFLHPLLTADRLQGDLMEKKGLVRALDITDLCLFTEARYTRHPSQADLHSAFQDHPVSLEHFPSGSIVFPPAVVRSGAHEVD